MSSDPTVQAASHASAPASLPAAAPALSRLAVLIDALAERLAFERMGIRLYDAALERCRCCPQLLSSEETSSLHDFRGEECLHVELVRDTLRGLGVETDDCTPGASRVGATAAGLLQVLASPATAPRQALQSLLDAELLDNAGWDLLIEVSRAVGRQDLANSFNQALIQENRHLHTVRDIVARLTLDEAVNGTSSIG